MRRWVTCAAVLGLLGCSHGPLWRSAEYQQQTVDLWGQLAQRYANRTIVAGYDLLNEPIPDDDAQLVDLYRRIVQRVRQVDPNHVVFLEGAEFATRFSEFAEPLDSNQAYSFHLYTWFGQNPEAALRTYRGIAQTQGVPFWNGEYGENSYEETGKSVTAFRASEGQGWMVGTGYWTWKHALPHNSPGLAGFETSDGWKKLVTFLTRGGPRPSADEAVAVMNDFVDRSHVERCTVDERMAALLKPAAQPAWPGAQGGFVHRQGKGLVDGGGRPLLLDGVDLGGWLLWEAWIWGAPLALLHLDRQAEGHVQQGLKDLVGEPAARAFEQRIFHEFIAEADVQRIAALGFNVVRVPVAARSLQEGGWEVVDALLDAAERAGVYVVLDLHGAPGGQSPYFTADPG